jgi:hypothetical protein
MRKKQRKHSEQWYTKILLGMLCEGVSDGDPMAESLLCSWQPDGHKIAALIRYEKRGPLALLS